MLQFYPTIDHLHHLLHILNSDLAYYKYLFESQKMNYQTGKRPIRHRWRFGYGTGKWNFFLSYRSIQARACKDRTSVSWFFNDWDTATAGNVVIGETAALVFINSNSGKHWQIIVDGNDGNRNNPVAWNNNTIVITLAPKPEMTSRMCCMATGTRHVGCRRPRDSKSTIATWMAVSFNASILHDLDF
ncbi:hypothetical protein HGRIS_001532 [Hohenbuehelia grisea]|uniref:Uncharacterized protein n=1 Tax=Hohenbuehelia grisea TaxID=104357 RepID=A0ABR3JPL9_9AGAR